MTIFKKSAYLIVFLLTVHSNILHAELIIDITEGIQSKHKIAVVPFALHAAAASKETEVISKIISSDLSASGDFTVLEKESMLSSPTKVKQVKYRHWAVTGQDYLVIGSILKEGKGYKIKVALLDIVKKEQINELRLNVSAGSMRKAAHHLSDAIYKSIMGIDGIFSSRIAYVTTKKIKKKQKQYSLFISDYDGHNAVAITKSKEPLMSPAWSPNGQHIAYVSFENKVSEIFVQTLATGKRRSVAKHKGINGSPAWSPNGKQLAITLSKSGNSDIYVLTLANSSLRQLTRSWAIDTEASWSPDGKNILFTSNRGKGAQLYIVPSNGRNTAERLTFDGDYNARGSFSKDGKRIVMIHAEKGNYRVAILDRASQETTVLSNGRSDESPSFSPNGQVIIYARRKEGKEILALVSVDGLKKQDIKHTTGSVREPVWAPKR
ncbi:MAG: Tol-Pal system beta propeller repeat protein TolB [Methyloprofundus sp.]|nr:Tol-Pal system beta propeller repeat protein TolB [Methyloprofundus sp.]